MRLEKLTVILTAVVEAVEKLTRPTCTIILVMTMCYLAVRSGITLSPDQFLPVVTMVLGFWFGQRSTQPAIVVDRRNDASGN